MKTIEEYALESGYVKSPNTQYEWYPGHPGLPAMPRTIFTLTITDKVWLSAHRYGTGELVPVLAFDTWGDAWSYMLINGVRSKAGECYLE